MNIGNDSDQTVISSRLLLSKEDDTRKYNASSQKVISDEEASLNPPKKERIITQRFLQTEGNKVLGISAQIFFKANTSIARTVHVFRYLHDILKGEVTDLNEAHQRFTMLLKTYESDLIKDGITEIRARILLYALCATVDDIILQFKNALGTIWTNKSMISIFFNETWGGERFFILLSQMMKSAPSHVSELEVYYLCLELGFEGRYRLSPNDREIRRIKDELYEFLRTYRPTLPIYLSPSWRGERLPARRVRKDLSQWLFLTSSILAILTIFIFMSNYLTQKRFEAEAFLRSFHEFSPASSNQEEAPDIKSSPVPKPLTVLNDLSPIISDLQQNGLLSVSQKNGQIIINTTQEVFGSASAVLREQYIPIFIQVAKTLNGVPGQIEVLGNTDSVPIRSRLYADNQVLSESRAQAVADLLMKYVSNGESRITYRGKGSSQPVGDNATSEGRLKNRRIEIIVKRL